ncbi:hypothetical protein [Lactococcus kimchii]|uniref:hypothetical protein n=1 Tax=Lactococcus sp. S-13 TaxID=2507158 RepID=UPI0010239D1F|nr:hypothetical protein [Lactococcus sp. S-13]RZI47891.1 hypothetical protein EQJ87_10745 [Lactococcus sp. S-13]
MPNQTQEPTRYKVKNGTENDIWDESQLLVFIFGAVFAALTSFFVVPIDFIRYLWLAFVVGLTFWLTMRSHSNKNMRNYMVIYTYLFCKRGRYDLTKNKNIKQ